MRAYEFLTEPQNPESAVAEALSTHDSDTGLDRRIAAKKRTIANIKKSIDMEKVRDQQKTLGQKLADIVARHRKKTDDGTK